MFLINPFLGFGLSSLAFVASATSSSDTIVIPASSQTGDLAILCDWGWSNSHPQVIPAGWTNFITQNLAGGLRGDISYKVLVGADPGATITGGNATNDSKIMLVFRPNATITTITPADMATSMSGVDPTAQVILASAGIAPLVVLGFGGWSSGALPSFTTESPALTNVTVNDLRVGYKIYDSAPQDHTVDIGDSGNTNWLASCYVAVA
jgi:hypothetical protein